MIVEVDITKCVMNNITPDHYILLYFLFHKDFDQIERIFGRDKAIKLRNSLNHSKYILSDITASFTTTVLTDEVKLLFGIKNQKINFWEWYSSYPIRAGNRVLRAANPTSVIALKHQRKYLLKVTTLEEHERVCNITKNYVALKMMEKDGIKFLQNAETVLNNALWDNWEVVTNGNEYTETKNIKSYGTRIE
jgi:hypothetical protein